jgi:hypothetical protein
MPSFVGKRNIGGEAQKFARCVQYQREGVRECSIAFFEIAISAVATKNSRERAQYQR